MHRFYSLIIFYLFVVNVSDGQYFQQQCDFDLDLILTDDLNILQAEGAITYYNNAPYPLDTIYFHLWANAFDDSYSAFADQQLKMFDDDFVFASERDRGRFEKLAIPDSIGHLSISTDNADMGYLVLIETLNPGQILDIPIKFNLRIPYQFSRLGKKGDYIQLAHWFPKPAVYDKEGWHWFPYLAAGEFYSEFGDYNIRLTVPDHLMVVNTGVTEKIEQDNESKILKITAENVIDMAICLHPYFALEQKEYLRQDGTSLDLKIFYDLTDKIWSDSAMHFLEASINYYEKTIGIYLYPQITLVQSSRRAGGMEYPMLITVSADNYKTLDYYINHEVGHQWFYGILAFNERESAYLDEGLTTYYEHLYTIAKRGVDYHSSNFPSFLIKDMEMPILQLAYLWQKRRGFSEPPNSDPRNMSMINYGINAYERAAYVYGYLSDYLGEEDFNLGIQAFYKKWKHKHPGIEDLVGELENSTGKECSWIIPLLTDDVTVDFRISKRDEKVTVRNNGNTSLPIKLLNDKGELYWQKPLAPGKDLNVKENVTGVNTSFLGLELNGDDNNLGTKSFTTRPLLGIDHSRKKEVYFAPLLSWNYGNGLGLGAAFYNSTFPPRKFQYLIAPQYGLSSNGLIGNAWMAYNSYPSSGRFRKIQYKLSTKRYTNFYSEINDYRTQYLRVVPQVSFHFRNEANSQKYSKLTLRTIFINQEFADFSGAGEFIIDENNFLFNQIRYDYFDYNIINRKEFYFLGEQHSYESPFGDKENYIKLSTAFKYQLKYKSSHSINFRIFAAGFLKNTQRNSSSYNSDLSRGSIALLSQGYNDYTYEEYFLNRQQGDGPFTNQVSSATGGFKDALGYQYNIGLSNDYAVSFHVSGDLPMNLPKLFKLKPYIDVGYYRSKSTLSDPLQGKTIYSGGLMLSYLDGALEIYFPFFSSSSINNIYNEQGENIFNRISFSIDLHRINPWDLIDDLNF